MENLPEDISHGGSINRQAMLHFKAGNVLLAKTAEAVVLAGKAEERLCGVSDHAVKVETKPGRIKPCRMNREHRAYLTTLASSMIAAYV
jgi:hypothetical protein